MPSGQGQAGSRGFDRERVIFYERRGGLRCFRPQICGRRDAEAAEGAPLNSDNERLFHHRAFEVLIADLDDLMFDNRKADGSKRRLRHQAGMHPKPWFVGGAGAFLYQLEQPPEQVAALRFGPGKGEVDIAPVFDTHKPEDANSIAANGNILGRQPRFPLRPAPAHRIPSGPLRLPIFARPIAHGVKHRVREFGVVGGGGPREGVEIRRGGL